MLDTQVGHERFEQSEGQHVAHARTETAAMGGSRNRSNGQTQRNGSGDRTMDAPPPIPSVSFEELCTSMNRSAWLLVEPVIREGSGKTGAGRAKSH